MGSDRAPLKLASCVRQDDLPVLRLPAPGRSQDISVEVQDLPLCQTNPLLSATASLAPAPCLLRGIPAQPRRPRAPAAPGARTAAAGSSTGLTPPPPPPRATPPPAPARAPAGAGRNPRPGVLTQRGSARHWPRPPPSGVPTPC